MPGKGKGKQKKKQPSGQANKAVKTVKQPEEDEFDDDMDNIKDDDNVDVEEDDNILGTGEQEVTVKSKIQEEKHTTELSDKSKMEDNVVEENGAVGGSPSEKKLTRKEMKKMKKKACKK